MGKECHAANAGKPKVLEHKAVKTAVTTALNTYKTSKKNKTKPKNKGNNKKICLFYLVNDRESS